MNLVASDARPFLNARPRTVPTTLNRGQPRQEDATDREEPSRTGPSALAAMAVSMRASAWQSKTWSTEFPGSPRSAAGDRGRGVATVIPCSTCY